MSELPSPLKSPVPIDVPARSRDWRRQPRSPMTLVPFISQIAASPLVFCQQNVGLAVAVEVAGADRRASSAQGWRPPAPPIKLVPVHLPDRDRAAVVFCQRMSDIAVAVEIARCRRRASSSRDWRRRAPPPMTLVPFISQIATVPLRVLPQNVGLAVAVEVAGSVDVPARSGLRDDAAADRSWCRSSPRSRPVPSGSARECRNCRRR